MTLGEVKAEALKLMFAGSDLITEGTVEGLQADENYDVYLQAMPGSINRCFADLESKGAIEQRTVELQNAFGFHSGGKYCLEIPSYVNKIVRAARVSTDEYVTHEDFDVVGSLILFDPPSNEETSYILTYEPRVTRVTIATPNDTQIDLSEEAASLVPYYIKGDLFRNDEPTEAAEARNYYEAGAAALAQKIASRPVGVQRRVEDLYDI